MPKVPEQNELRSEISIPGLRRSFRSMSLKSRKPPFWIARERSRLVEKASFARENVIDLTTTETGDLTVPEVYDLTMEDPDSFESAPEQV